MLFFFAFVAVVCALGVIAGRMGLYNPPEQADPAADSGSSGKPRVVSPVSLEGVLAAQLVAGEITADQYRRAIEGLAARDDERHPMAVPPEIGPADA